MPLESLVVITYPNALVKTSPSNIPLPSVIRTPSLLDKINALKEIHKEEIISSKEIRKFCKLLVKHHSTGNPDILQQFGINELDLLTGVQCPQCATIPMERKWGKWVCSNCCHSSKDAHLQALNDYYLLFQSIITNKKLRDFLQLSSSMVANKILTSMKIPFSGDKKARKYYLPFDD
ncbi:hypothetical protein WD019_09595 [Fictibacillus sp. Mic-4]|uniref:hypothetical protein n=1 Tax=Fictibacillus sp. Mic-4 TaxID=3132826 RepID=UPI003CF79E1E